MLPKGSITEALTLPRLKPQVLHLTV